MRDGRKAAFWLCLFGSVSLAALSAVAQEVTSAPDSEAAAIEAPLPVEPSFHDVAASSPAAEPAIPALEAAPVVITAADIKPALDIPLPDPAPVAAAMQQDMLRIAVEKALSDDSALRDLRLTKREREGLSAYYAQAERPLAWAQDGAWTRAAKAAMERIKAADEDGLDPADYPLPRTAAGSAPAAWAEADVKLSAAVVRYARDARGGRIEPSRLSPLVTPKLEIPSPEEVLAKVSAAENADAALDSYNPQHPGYRALKQRLVQLRASHPTRVGVRVPKGPILRVGMQDPRVPLIRDRLNIGKDAANQTTYDERLASAVAAFQKQNGLPDTGNLTPQTVAALSGPSVAEREAALIANMERWRWLPADLGERHIFVNVPEFRLRLFENGHVAHETRVIVGKQESQTPIFSESMKYLVVNPSWTIPPSIMKKEILPALANDPTYAERKGYRVIRKGDRITVQQPPGERNALGFLKFMFPNQHSVYLHDTPNRSLFAASKRAFSHGCVRVDQPFQLAEEVLGQDGKWTESKLRALIGKGERYVYLSRPLPVHLTYFTLAADDKGELKSYEDLYGLDRKIRAALNLPE